MLLSPVGGACEGYSKHKKEELVMKTLFRSLVIALGLIAFAASSAWAGSVTIPNTFSAGTKAEADKVNENFTAVKTAVDDNDARINTLNTGIEFADIGSSSDIPTTIRNCGSIVLTAPQAGFIFVQVSGYAEPFGANTVVDVGIGDSTTAFDFYTRAGLLDGTDTFRRVFPINVSGVYSVAAGSKTIYLLAQVESTFSAQTVNLGKLYISAIFVPTRY